jgi:hypothetical protein
MTVINQKRIRTYEIYIVGQLKKAKRDLPKDTKVVNIIQGNKYSPLGYSIELICISFESISF